VSECLRKSKIDLACYGAVKKEGNPVETTYIKLISDHALEEAVATR